MINLTIDNCKIQGHAGQTILSAAQEARIFIPSLCQDDNFPAHGSCGICVVEIVGVGRLVRACATAIVEGMEVSTCSDRVVAARKRLLELLLSNHTGDCKAPCQLACPAQSDCQGYIAMIADGRLEDAFQCMMEAHPFPASIGRVCPRPCETKCRRGIHDEPVNIAGLKRFAADMVIGAGITGYGYMPEIYPDTGQAVAIVGGGPAGLTAAYFLRRVGHEVSVFEHMPKMGGLLRYGIPEYRLPKAVLDAEIGLLAQMGVQFSNGVKIISPSHLKKRYNAVIIAIGAGISRPMGIPGEDLPGVVGGVDFLRKVAIEIEMPASERSGPKMAEDDNVKSMIEGKRVIVIGGSNTAIDAARTALRLGADAVIVAYRRTKDEMPAEPIEILEAEEEGVQFKFLVAPIEITAASCPSDCGNMQAKANGIQLQVMELGEPDAAGRRSPKSVPGQEEWLEGDTIIAAIGQSVDLTGLEDLDKKWSSINADPVTFKTSQSGIFAIGDATGQSAYAIEAIGHGRKAAAAVHEFLIVSSSGTTETSVMACQAHNGNNLPWETLPNILVKDEKQPSDFAHIPKSSRENNPKKEAPEGFQEMHLNLTATQAVNEAKRCLSCGCDGYNECKLIQQANQYSADPDKYLNHTKPQHPLDYDNPLFIYDPNKCVLCGLCVRACEKDRAVLTMAHRGIETSVVAHPQSNCARCGNCAAICPVGARTPAFPGSQTFSYDA